MMTDAVKVIIGANYGDEGKGLMTDYFAARHGAKGIVVRFNGGAQAGHTVVTPQGRRHVFGHIGAGTFAGADTFLSRHFVCNPSLFAKEVLALAGLTVLPNIYVDGRALVTTPYDMMINQFAEQHRKDARHGSCGVGFGETIERCEDDYFALTVFDLLEPELVMAKLVAIRSNYMLSRMGALGIPGMWRDNLRLITSDAVVVNYLEDCAKFLMHVRLATPDILTRYDSVIMEGAQGLLLDQKRGHFPHVTRSHTGVLNALDVASEAGLGRLDVVYVTRAYLTRHGAGPLPGECCKPYDGIYDQTNAPNDFQGALRFAHLDLDELVGRIKNDFMDAAMVPATMNLAVTCLDQVGFDVFYYQDDILHKTTPLGLLRAIELKIKPATLYSSYGAVRDCVVETSINGRPSRSKAMEA